MYGVGSEDMDTLTFGAPILLRHLTFSEARKMPIVEVHLERVLAGLGVTMEQFIDLCILLGCDYCATVKGVGPAKAVSLIKEHGSIDKALSVLDPSKIDTDWEYQQARLLFKTPLVLEEGDAQLSIKWSPPPDPEALIDFLCKEHGFNEKRVRSAVDKLCKLGAVSTQKRMDDFFKAKPAVKKEEPLVSEQTSKRPATKGKVAKAGKKLKVNVK